MAEGEKHTPGEILMGTHGVRRRCAYTASAAGRSKSCAAQEVPVMVVPPSEAAQAA